jgi:hypothetical protein
VLAALAAGNDLEIDHALEDLLARMSPAATLPRPRIAPGREAREDQLAMRLARWAEAMREPPNDAARKETTELNGLLRTRFSRLDVALDKTGMTLLGHRHPSLGLAGSENEVRFSRREWTRFSRLGRRSGGPAQWDDAEILGALQRWTDQNGLVPTATDWLYAGADHPDSATVRRHFANWPSALRSAGLRPTNPRVVKKWSEVEIVQSLQAWAQRHGRAPLRKEWIRGTSWHPCKTTVCTHFGSWSTAVLAAGLTTTPT